MLCPFARGRNLNKMEHICQFFFRFLPLSSVYGACVVVYLTNAVGVNRLNMSCHFSDFGVREEGIGLKKVTEKLKKSVLLVTAVCFPQLCIQ